MSKQVISEIADRNAFMTLLQNNPGIIVIKLGAEWCGPCKKMLPILSEIADEGIITIGKLNADENPVKSSQFSVSSIPTMILFKDGQPVHTVIGAMPKHRLIEEISAWI